MEFQHISYHSDNQAGRVTNQRMTYPATGPLNMTAAYTWDNEGRVTSLAYPQSGPVAGYQQ